MPKQTKNQPEQKKEKLNEFGLTDLEEQFCHEYMVDLNQTQAYKRCRPDAKASTAATNSWRMLRNAKVQHRIQQLCKERAERTDVTADRVLLELARLGFSNYGHYASWDGEGVVTLTPSNELSEGQLRAVKKVKRKVRRIPTKNGEDIEETTLELELTGKEQSLKMMGSHLAMFKDGPQNQMIVNYNFPDSNKQKPAPGGQ